MSFVNRGLLKQLPHAGESLRPEGPSRTPPGFGVGICYADQVETGSLTDVLGVPAADAATAYDPESNLGLGCGRDGFLLYRSTASARKILFKGATSHVARDLSALERASREDSCLMPSNSRALVASSRTFLLPPIR